MNPKRIISFIDFIKKFTQFLSNRYQQEFYLTIIKTIKFSILVYYQYNYILSIFSCIILLLQMIPNKLDSWIK